MPGKKNVTNLENCIITLQNGRFSSYRGENLPFLWHHIFYAKKQHSNRFIITDRQTDSIYKAKIYDVKHWKSLGIRWYKWVCLLCIHKIYKYERSVPKWESVIFQPFTVITLRLHQSLFGGNQKHLDLKNRFSWIAKIRCCKYLLIFRLYFLRAI